jgi:dihydrofolate reductase
MSIDGFIAGPDGELDWMTWDLGDDLEKYMNFILELHHQVDTILLGRKMTEGFISYWENVADNHPDSPEYVLAEKMVNTPKVVFSKTLNEVKGRNVSLAKGGLADEIANLKNAKGNDIMVYGGAEFVSALIAGRHIDEFNFLIDPVLINKGLRIFDTLDKRQKLISLGATGYECGVNVLRYRMTRE